MARETAFRILRSGDPLPLRALDRAARESRLDDRDRGLLRKLVATEVRRRGTLRAIVRTFAHGKPNSDVAALLHLGIVQLVFLDNIPVHAAVNETVALTDVALGRGRAGYVNATLRAILAARVSGSSGNARRDIVGRDWHFTRDVFNDPIAHPLLWAEDALSMPTPLVKRWIRRYGQEKAFALARSALDEADLSLRVARGSRAAVRELLEHELAPIELALRPGAHEQILLAPSAVTAALVLSSPFREGLLTVQGESALRAAELLEARAGERILELCSAPGGKTAVLAASGAEIIACDDDDGRCSRLRETLTRLVPDARVEVRIQDGAGDLPTESFDAALVDVPCSNTGVLASRADARWRFSTTSQAELAVLQARLLVEAARCVRTGGRLVYSTCSIEPEENQRRVRAFLTEHPEFSLEAEIDALPEPRGAHGPIDGGYAARLRRA